jgi:manganese-dependent inorganic pyrophosphatase
MLKAGASLEGRSTRVVLTTDMKDFNMGKYLVTVAQVNTMDSNEFTKNKEIFIAEMENIRKERDGDLFIFMITDLLRDGSLVIFSGNEPEILGKAFELDISKDNHFLEGVVSRKKQMIPRLMSAV